ncbi:hypothetical protein V8C42DRAFT_334007 [Trichoderma barbatum]
MFMHRPLHGSLIVIIIMTASQLWQQLIIYLLPALNLLQKPGSYHLSYQYQLRNRTPVVGNARHNCSIRKHFF